MSGHRVRRGPGACHHRGMQDLTAAAGLQRRDGRHARPRRSGSARQRHARRRLAGTGAPGGAGRVPDGVRAGSGPDHPLEGVPPPEAQDAGLPQPGGRPLRHSPDAHHAGHPGRAIARRGAEPQRAAGRGDRPGPRRRPLPVRAHRRGRAQPVLRARRVAPRRAVGAHLRGPRGSEPDLGGARRHPRPLLEDRPAARDARGVLRPLRRSDRLPGPRCAGRAACRRPGPRRLPGRRPRAIR